MLVPNKFVSVPSASSERANFSLSLFVKALLVHVSLFRNARKLKVDTEKRSHTLSHIPYT